MRVLVVAAAQGEHVLGERGLLEGQVVVSYGDGTAETIAAGDLFYWPPGHSVRVESDAEVVLFSPTHEHTVVMDHMKAKMGL